MLLVADLLEPLQQKSARIFGPQRAAGAKLQVVHVAAKFVQAADCFAAQQAAQRRRKQGLEQAHLVFAGKHAQLCQGLVANAAFRCGHRAQKGRVVVVVDPQAEPAAQILDFSPVKEARAAGYLVRNLCLAQRFLEGLGLVVGAVQHGKVPELLELRPAVRQTTGTQALDAGHRALGLVLFAVRVHYPHRLAFAQVAPQILGEQLRIRADHIVGGAQDGAGGTVVLLQLDDLERGKVDRQFFQIVQRGAAPAVNRLVVVAHGGKTGTRRRVAADQQFQHFVLRGIGVLVLIHQHMAHQPLPLLPHLLMIL